MTRTKEVHMLDQNLLKSHSYNTSVLSQTTEQNDMKHVFEVEVIHEIFIIKTIHKTDIAIFLEIDSVLTRVLLIHNTLDHNVTITKEIFAILSLFLQIFLQIPL